MPDTGNAKDCLELPPTNFSIFTLKNVTWRTYLISVFYFVLFAMYRACFTHLISSNLSCNLCLWYYDKLVHFDKYRQNLWEYRLRVVPHFSSGVEERAKRGHAWKFTSREKRRHAAGRGKKKSFLIFLSPRRVSPFLAWGYFHSRSRFARSTIPEEKWGTTVVHWEYS